MDQTWEIFSLSWYHKILRSEPFFFASIFLFLCSLFLLSLYIFLASASMAAENIPAPVALVRAYGVTNIHIPFTLDIDDHNYDAWRDLFLTHCLTFDVLGHLDGTSVPANNNDTPWQKRDDLVKLWLYGTLSKTCSAAYSKLVAPLAKSGFALKTFSVITRKLVPSNWTMTCETR